MFNDLTDWLVGALASLVGLVYKNQRERLKEIEEELSSYKDEQNRLIQIFVTKDYIEKDIKPILNNMDEKMKTLVTQTADVIKRTEYKMDITALHERINSLEKRKIDKEKYNG